MVETQLSLVIDPQRLTTVRLNPAQLAGLDPATFADEQTFELIRQTVIDTRVRAEPHYALSILRALRSALAKSQALQKSNPALYEQYRLMTIFTAANALVWQPVNVQQSIFSSAVNFLLDQEVDLYQEIADGYLYHGYDLEENIRFSDSLLYALRQNTETIGEQPITVKQRLIKPTISAWLEDYEDRVPAGRPRHTIDRARYLNQSIAAQRLPPPEKNRLLEVTKIYDFLRFPAAYEEPVVPTEHAAVVTRPAPTPGRTVTAPPVAKQPAPSMFPPARPRPTPVTAGGADDAIAQTENELLRQTNGEVAALRITLFDAIKSNDRARIIASLLLLARLSDLRRILVEDTQLANVYEKNVVPTLVKSLSIDATKVTRTYTPAHLREFLKFVLTRAVGGETEAARYGAQIEAVMRSTGVKEYTNLTYFEPRQGIYRWAQAQVDELGNLQ